MLFAKVHKRKSSYYLSYLYKFRIPIFKQFNIYKHFTNLNIGRKDGCYVQMNETYSELENNKHIQDIPQQIPNFHLKNPLYILIYNG